MPKNPNLKKVLIIGSGPIIIGQAAEFDYSGTQACKAIREEGIQTVLVNSNPATIMTDREMADRVYLEPLQESFLEKIIEKERPDGMLAGFGGQTGLNLAMNLEEQGILKKYGVSLLGIKWDSIQKAEDRDSFKKLMLEIGEPIPPSIIATHLPECLEFARDTGYPLIIRPAYTLGGTGGGIAHNETELIQLCNKGIENSAIGQILLEKSVAGWKEIEYEVMRDASDNCIIICNMENFDPVGIHTGDSVVVAPSQTLRDQEYQRLRNASLKIIRSLEIEGGCNIQFALNPDNGQYIVIEVNPRVSRSSALASKAAGYPIAKIAAKIALGYRLDELKNYVTRDTSACFEPALDYCVVKFPKWPFDKFVTATRTLGTQMKATGEVMAIDRTFESALIKAVTSLEGKYDGLHADYITAMTDAQLLEKIDQRDDDRIFAVTECLRRVAFTHAQLCCGPDFVTPSDNPEEQNAAHPGCSLEELHQRTKIDRWFLGKVDSIIHMEVRLSTERLDQKLLKEAKTLGFTNNEIIRLNGVAREVITDMRVYHDIFPVYKMVDTCGGEFDAATPYYYSCYDGEDESSVSSRKKILVVGSGPIRIGQGVEFDYCCVHGVWAIGEAGYESLIINNNPETVSTDFDTSDKLYFESLHIDDVMNVIKRERPEGVILQFGGQTALNLAEQLYSRSIDILGTPFPSIDLAEDREKCNHLLQELNIPTPRGLAVTTSEEAFAAVKELGYPLVVRPSYVIGGRAMQVVYTDEELSRYLTDAVQLSSDHPVIIDQYIQGKEIEVDAVADGQNVLIPGVMEHIERTGIHSGDSISVYPTFTLPEQVITTLEDYTRRIVQALKIVGLVNIQYAWDGRNVYVIEINPRASRTVPILSKVTDVPMVKLAVETMLGKPLNQLGYGTGLYPVKDRYAVKVPVFSGEKLTDIDVALGPEMKSTGEVLGLDTDLRHALYKGFCAAGISIPTSGGLYVSLRDTEKTPKTASILKKYQEQGFALCASKETAEFLQDNGIPASFIKEEEVLAGIGDKTISAVINVPRRVNHTESPSFHIRRKATDYRLPVMTCMDTADAFLTAITIRQAGEDAEGLDVYPL